MQGKLNFKYEYSVVSKKSFYAMQGKRKSYESRIRLLKIMHPNIHMHILVFTITILPYLIMMERVS